MSTTEHNQPVSGETGFPAGTEILVAEMRPHCPDDTLTKRETFKPRANSSAVVICPVRPSRTLKEGWWTLCRVIHVVDRPKQLGQRALDPGGDVGGLAAIRGLQMVASPFEVVKKASVEQPELENR